MFERIRFHLDEHINPAVARALRTKGVDVTTTKEAGLLGQDDPQQWAYVQKEKRVLVTFDADFLRVAKVRQKHWGLVFCGLKSRTVGALVKNLLILYEVLEADEMVGQVEFLWAILKNRRKPFENKYLLGVGRRLRP